MLIYICTWAGMEGNVLEQNKINKCPPIISYSLRQAQDVKIHKIAVVPVITVQFSIQKYCLKTQNESFNLREAHLTSSARLVS